MTRTPFAIVATLALAATAGACAPQCTCPASVPGVATIPAPAPADAPPPVSAPVPPAAPPSTPPSVPQAAPATAGPVRLLNGSGITRRMRSAYPPHLLDAGVSGDVMLDVTLDAQGQVESVTEVENTEVQFVAPALALARDLRFSAPAQPGVTLRVRMRFQTSGSRITIVNP